MHHLSILINAAHLSIKASEEKNQRVRLLIFNLANRFSNESHAIVDGSQAKYLIQGCGLSHYTPHEIIAPPHYGIITMMGGGAIGYLTTKLDFCYTSIAITLLVSKHSKESK